MPKVTIGLPVYNEAPFIEATIKCLLDQTDTDFELLVCDNASTDGTLDIARRIASSDSRVSFHPSEKNEGAIVNFHRAMRMAKAPYFMWAGGHDIFSKDYVKKLRLVLDADPTCSLAYADSQFVAYDGSEIPGEPVETGLELSHESAAERFKVLVWKLHRCDLVHGLMRHNATNPQLLIGRAPDFVVLAGLAVEGKFRRVPELMFYRRRNRGVENVESRKEHLVREGFIKAEDPDVVAWRGLRDSLIGLLDHSNISARERHDLRLAASLAFKERFLVPWDITEGANWHERLRLRFAKGDALENLKRRIENRVVSRAKLADDVDVRTHLEREIASLSKENQRLRRELANLKKKS